MKRLVVAALVMVVTAASVAAAETCGDATGDEVVTVTDGVQALRAAAELSSSCGDGCDADGNGAITVSDGVNILRKAAGLPIVEACKFTTEEGNEVVNPSFSIFDGITKTPGIVPSSAAPAAGECENDGTIATTSAGTTATSVTTFTNCEIAGAILDGRIARGTFAQGVALAFQDLTITKVGSARTLSVSGQLGVATERTGKRLGGTLTIVSSARGTFTIEFQRILIVADGSARQGTLIFDLTGASTPKIKGIRIEFGDSDDIPVTVLLRNDQTLNFILDRNLRILRRIG